MASWTKPRAVRRSRRSVIGANRTRWKRASQPASLPPWPAGSTPASRSLSSRPPQSPGWIPRAAGVRRRRRRGCVHQGLRRQQLPLHRRAGRLRPESGVQGVRRRRAPHHRPRARAPHGRPARRDVAVRQGGLHHHRRQALLRAPRHRLVPGVRRHQEQHLQVPGGRGVFHHHHAARAESLAGGHQRAGQVATAEAA